MKFRHDIDGLRTVAVLPVVFYHAGYTTFAGGFVGVDVFFVISGFLITSLITAEIKAGTFSILSFYERRIRRIFPALFAMMASTLLLGGAILLPADFSRLGQSTAAAATFWANFFFWWNGDYFAAVEVKPLLHTWSLAVEEQFYIVFPLLLCALYKSGKRRWTLPLAGLMVTSFVLSVWQVRSDPIFTFFWPHLRAWELLMGSMLALGAMPPVVSRYLREIMTVAGLTLVGWAVFTFDHNTLFPGEAALVPCLGAALIIHAGSGGGSVVARFLSLKPMTWIGRLSYSLYLWHMPFIILSAYYNIEPLSDLQVIFVLSISFISAVLSYYFVEQPFRQTKRRQGFIFISGMAMSAAALAAFLFIFLTDGFPARFSDETLRYANMMDKELYFPIYDRGRCFLDYDQGANDYSLEACARPSNRQRILIWGDSFAANLYPGLSKQTDASVYQYTATSCRPIFLNNYRRCDQIYERFTEISTHIDPDVIIIGGYWPKVVRDLGTSIFSDRLRESIRIARDTGAEVVVVGQSPTYAFALPRLAFMYPEVRSKPEALYSASDWSNMNRIIAAVADAENVHFHDFYRECDGTICTAFLEGNPLHWDNGHMTMAGSLFYTQELFSVPSMAALK